MVFEIRTAGPADAAGVAGVWAAVMPQLVKTARAIELELRDGRSRIVLVAADGSDVIGYANLYLPPADAVAPRVRIAVLVPPAARGQGVGSALLTEISA